MTAVPRAVPAVASLAPSSNDADGGNGHRIGRGFQSELEFCLEVNAAGLLT
jgi:hypothetical protein